MNERMRLAINGLLQAAQDSRKAGANGAAAERYAAVLHMDPDCIVALQNISPLLADQKHHLAAVVASRRALANDPENMHLLGNLGTMLYRMGHYADAKQCLIIAVKRDPEEYRHWHNLGLVQYALGEPEEAVRCMEQAYKLAPGEAPIVRDLALSYFACGEWTKGFRLHEARWSELGRGAAWDLGIPVWRGEDLSGKTLLVHHEQGFGDTIQFSRLITKLKPKFNVQRIVLAVPWQLQRLMASAALADEVVSLVRMPFVTDVDYHIPIMSLPEFIDLGEFLLEKQAPYLSPPTDFGVPVRRAENTLLTVGICWAGSPNYARDHFRSMPFEMFLSVCDIPGVQVFSLQTGRNSIDITKAGATALVTDPTNLVHDFADLAALIDAMDLVVSVDTAPLHLAGAMGKDTIALLPFARCWRWLAKRDDTPFYPSMKLITQPQPGDWESVMRRVREHLADRLEALPIFDEEATQVAAE